MITVIIPLSVHIAAKVNPTQKEFIIERRKMPCHLRTMPNDAACWVQDAGRWALAWAHTAGWSQAPRLASVVLKLAFRSTDQCRKQWVSGKGLPYTNYPILFEGKLYTTSLSAAVRAIPT